jgi:hypothetical protein
MLKDWESIKTEEIDIAWGNNTDYSQIKFNFINAKQKVDADGKEVDVEPPEEIKRIKMAYDKLMEF